MTKKPVPTPIDEYINNCPDNVQPILQTIRKIVKEAAPGAIESISYQIPAFHLRGKVLIYFGAWKNHIALYPLPSGDAALEKEMAPYRGGKGTLRLPLNQPIPYDLVEKVAKARLKQAED